MSINDYADLQDLTNLQLRQAMDTTSVRNSYLFSDCKRNSGQVTDIDMDRISIIPQAVLPDTQNSLESPETPEGLAELHTTRRQNGDWLEAATQSSQEMRQRMSLAGDHIGHSIRQLYVSASSLADVPPSYDTIPGVVPHYHDRSSDLPPTYDDVINPHAQPPSYQSLFGRMRQARKSSRGLIDLLKRLVVIMVGMLGCSILFILTFLIPSSMIIVGAIYIDQCHVEHIPAFLLVGGIVWTSKNIIQCCSQCKKEELDHIATAEQQQQQQPLAGSICESLLNCVLFGWYIAGCFIVFRNFTPDFENSSSPRYCNRVVYMYTFWLIVSFITYFGLIVSCICCFIVSLAIKG